MQSQKWKLHTDFFSDGSHLTKHWFVQHQPPNSLYRSCSTLMFAPWDALFSPLVMLSSLRLSNSIVSNSTLAYYKSFLSCYIATQPHQQKVNSTFFFFPLFFWTLETSKPAGGFLQCFSETGFKYNTIASPIVANKEMWQNSQ